MRISDWSSDVCSSDLHAQRAGKLGRGVGKDVAEQVVGDHDVELLGIANDLHRRVVRQDVLQPDVGIVASVQVGDDFSPQQSRIHHVGLFGAGHLVAAAAGQFEGHARSEVHTSELQSLLRISYAVFCLNKKTQTK